MLLAGFFKLLHREEFVLALREQAIIPPALLTPASFCIPAWEVSAASLAVLTLVWQRIGIGLGVVAVTFLSLGIYCAVLIWIPPTRPTTCGCGFSSAIVTHWGVLAFRNGSLAAAYGFAALILAPPLTPPAPAPG